MRKSSVFTTTEDISARYEIVGVIMACSVHAVSALADTAAEVRNFFGGEMHDYEKLIDEGMENALQKLIMKAEHKGADGVIGVKYSTVSISAGGAEIIVYGTAINFITAE